MPKEANLRFSAAWTEAERKARSARALLDEVPGSEGDAAVLLREAWSQLESARATLEPATPAPRSQQDGIPTELALVLSSDSEAGEPSAPSAELVHRAADCVDRALGELMRDAQGWNRYRRELRILASTVLGTLVVVAGIKIYDAMGPSVWLARVYPALEFKGNPEHLVLRNLQQDWGRGGVTQGIAASGFSARFDTCLKLKASTKVRFWMQSKGAANLYVDGRKLITNWNMTDTPNAKGKTTTLEPGSHHVSVDLVNQTGAGILSVQAGFDDGEPSPMDHHWFERPIAWPPEVPETEKKGKAKSPAVCAE